MLLLMKLFKASSWRNFHSLQLLRSSNQKLFLSRPFGNLGIGISATASSLALTLQEIIFAIRIFFFKKVEYLCSFLCLVMVSVPLCYKYLVLYDFLFIKSEASIDVLEKSYLNIRKHPSCCFKKATTPKNIQVKHPRLSSFKVHL